MILETPLIIRHTRNSSVLFLALCFYFSGHKTLEISNFSRKFNDTKHVCDKKGNLTRVGVKKTLFFQLFYLH